MNHLRRELAPVSERAWAEIEVEAQRALTNFLAARRLVAFSGPHGWDASAVPTGDVEILPDGPVAGVEAGLRRVRAYVELRARFSLRRSEIDAIDRGHKSPDLSPVVDAARRIALGEDHLVFHGFPTAGVE